MKCEICNQEFKTLNHLSKHIRYHHKDTNSREYYDKYMKKDGEGVCVVCGKPTKYYDMGTGYKETCGHSCACKLNRQRMKEDGRHEKFVEKVKANQTKIWQEREQNGTKQLIIDKAATRIRKNNMLLSDEERRERYGWMNKLSPDEKEKKVKEILDKSLKKWWKDADDETKTKLFKKRVDICVDKGVFTDRTDLKEWDNYKIVVRSLTERIYRKYKDIINPTNLKRGRKKGTYQIDHIVSVFDGFANNIPPEILCSPVNLRMMEATLNNSKHINSDMDIKQLFELYEDHINAISST